MLSMSSLSRVLKPLRQMAFTASLSSKATGTVKFFNNKKGFGFLCPSDGSPDVFVHQTAIYKEGFRSLEEGEPVEFDIVSSPDGKLSAANVTGPNGQQVQGTPPPERDPTNTEYRRFSDRGDGPKRYTDGPRSYPKRPYNDKNAVSE